MNYKDALEYLQHAMVFGIKPGLERISRLLFLLNEPQNQFPTIHVAGTNGKGSVCAMLESICRADNLKTGLYTSPHLTTYLERIRINNENVDEKTFANAIESVKNICDQMQDQPTHFEILTAAAFKIFADEKIDIGIIETGLGGTLDSTNVITPKISVITNIGEDHADKCLGLPGDTMIDGIARHKAGIIKNSVPIVTAAKGRALRIISEEAKIKNAKIYVYKKNFQTMRYIVNLKGLYQRENASVACKVAKLLNIDERSIRIGLENVTWAGRYEITTYKNHKLVIDGAHNPAGTLALRRSLDKDFPNYRRIFLMGVLKDKNYKQMLKNLLRPSDIFVATEPDSERALDKFELYDTAVNYSSRVEIGDLSKAVKIADDFKKTLIIVCGSLYLVGKVRDEVFS